MQPNQVNPYPVILIKFLDLATWVVYSVVPWGLLTVALYLLLRVMTAVSPAQSTAETFISLLSNVSRTRGFAFVFGFCGVVYGLQQRNLRRAEVHRLRARIAALEDRLAPIPDSSICSPPQG